MIDLYLLRYFLAVVETGSFTRAAERVFVTQPTLSSGIKKLEAELGTTLFDRSSKRVFLTDAGIRFLPRAKAILHECNLAMEAVRAVEEVPVLRLGLLGTLGNRQVEAFVSGYRERGPKVTLEIYDGTEQELLNRLDDRSLDYAISIWRGDDGHGATRLGGEPYVFILPRDHKLADRDSLSATDLFEERMIVRSRCEVLSETSRYFTDHNVRPRLVYRTPNDSRAVAMVAAGVGGTVVPFSLADERVVAKPLEGFSYRRDLALLKPRYQPTPAIERVAGVLERWVTDFWG